MLKIKKLFFKLLLIILFFEFLFGYYAFQLNNKKYGFYVPAIYKATLVVFRNLDKIRNKNISKDKIDDDKITKNLENENNYFVETFDKEVIKYHPFIDVSGGPKTYETSSGKFSIKRDYFGFRNNHSFDDNKNNDKFAIIITGGSECIGLFHTNPISDLLEVKLNSYFETKKIIVFNLCMNSHTLSNEIQNLVHIGYHMNPSLIISHTGWNDSKYFKFLPTNFKKISLIYWPSQIDWYNKLYDIKKSHQNNILFKNDDREIFEYALEKNINKYIKIANSFNSDLIVGVQAYNEKKYIDNIDLELLNIFEKKIESMNIHKINFNDYKKDFQFVDTSHTMQSTAVKIADIYFNYIINNFSEKIKKKILIKTL